MTVKLLTEHHLEFLSLKGSSEPSHVKMPHCWKSHALAQLHFLDDHERMYAICSATVQFRTPQQLSHKCIK